FHVGASLVVGIGVRSPECDHTRLPATSGGPSLRPRRSRHPIPPPRLGARTAPPSPSRRSGAALLHQISCNEQDDETLHRLILLMLGWTGASAWRRDRCRSRWPRWGP